MQYTLAELIKIIECFDLFKFAKIDLQNLIIEKIKNLKNYEATLEDLKVIMNFLPIDCFPILN
jgi:uncharacterized protein Smg (DUF494 family)